MGDVTGPEEGSGRGRIERYFWGPHDHGTYQGGYDQRFGRKENEDDRSDRHEFGIKKEVGYRHRHQKKKKKTLLTIEQ